MPQSLGKLAEALFGARAQLRERFPDGAERRRAIDEALREGGTLDPLQAGSDARVDEWLNNPAALPEPVQIEFTLSSADPEDLTLKQARLLGEADTVCADAVIPAEILARARADAVRITCTNQGCAKGHCPKTAPDGLTVILRWQA